MTIATELIYYVSLFILFYLIFFLLFLSSNALSNLAFTKKKGAMIIYEKGSLPLYKVRQILLLQKQQCPLSALIYVAVTSDFDWCKDQGGVFCQWPPFQVCIVKSSLWIELTLDNIFILVCFASPSWGMSLFSWLFQGNLLLSPCQNQFWLFFSFEEICIHHLSLLIKLQKN